MGAVGGYLFGSAPKVVQEPTPAPQPAITGAQQGTQDVVSSLLANLLAGGGAQYPGTYTGAGPQAQYAAPVTGQQTDLINQIVGQQLNGNVGATQNSALSALSSLFTPQQQSWQQAFNSIAQPLQQTFQQQTIPAIQAAQATSAGGTQQGGSPSVGFNGAINQATQNLTSAESNAASQLQYNSNQAAITNAISALGLAPSLTAAPGATASTALSAATIPQQTQQTQLSGQYANYQQLVQNFLSLLGVGSGFSTATDVAFPQGNTVVNPGQTGLINELLSAVAGGAGKAIGASDPRLKTDISFVRREGGFNIYRFAYLSEPAIHYEGVISNEVRRTRPDAVFVDSSGFDMVDYGALGLRMKRVA